MTEVQAFTGTAAEPLQELNDLLRLNGRVVGVEDRLNQRTSRRVGVARWYLTVRPVQKLQIRGGYPSNPARICAIRATSIGGRTAGAGTTRCRR